MSRKAATKKKSGKKPHKFRNKLILNQWLISLFGVDPLAENLIRNQSVRPFHALADALKNPDLEGLDHNNLHHFYTTLVNTNMFWDEERLLTKAQLLLYEENIVKHTLALNERRAQPIVWKYYQWLTLVFVEIYLDRYFGNREGLLENLNAFVGQFNQHYSEYEPVPYYEYDDLNKLCLQNATGSGKTLLMHINLMQFEHYARKHGQEKELSRVILLTPNSSLSAQHVDDFARTGLSADRVLETRNFFGGSAAESNLNHVDVLEITSLADVEGPNTIATRSLGDQNLLLVDEGHRGMSGKEEGAWFTRRTQLCAKGFTFEYSATFEQAVQASQNVDFENAYAKTVIFDYSYRWFYEDGFGKDYAILNLPQTFKKTETVYLTACLLKYYQQLRIYEDKKTQLGPFNLEKPLWVFVGRTVTGKISTKDDQAVASDVAQIIMFLADFLQDKQAATLRIKEILLGTGQDTGLLDQDGVDIFAGAFRYLAQKLNEGEKADDLYQNILKRMFNADGSGSLVLERVKGDSGEVALRVGASDTHFGLINVGEAKALCNHVEEHASKSNVTLTVQDSDFTEAMFSSVKDSSSPVNILLGSKKFIEGWDCWRVSTMGLMHVGKSEGTQIIQLFGRGVRLKGYDWSLKRSGHVKAPYRPEYIEELETLNVFGIEADFMDKFRQFLADEGLPGNERRTTITIPLNVTYDFGKKLKILRPKKKASTGMDYDFKKDAPVPSVGDIPEYLKKNPVVSDWYPRIQVTKSSGGGQQLTKEQSVLGPGQIELLDYDILYLSLEAFKRERSWFNLNITKSSIKALIADSSWYTLYLPKNRLQPQDWDGVRLLQQVATELLKRYCDHLYNYKKRSYLEPRLEVRELTPEDDNIPEEKNYQIIVDGDEQQVIAAIKILKQELAENKDELSRLGALDVCGFGQHLFQPLFHVKRGHKVSVLPVGLNESELQFVTDLEAWVKKNKKKFGQETELYLLRNRSRGKGVGFFEAQGFHPDFILWVVKDEQQYITFIEPHGMMTEGAGSPKVLFAKEIKKVQERLGDSNIILNSFILSWTKQRELNWGLSDEQYEEKHILFMNAAPGYLDKLFKRIIEWEIPAVPIHNV